MIGNLLEDKSKGRGQKRRKNEVRGLTLSEQRFGLFKLMNKNVLYVEDSCEHTVFYFNEGHAAALLRRLDNAKNFHFRVHFFLCTV